MGFVDRIKQKLGKTPPLPADAEAAIQEELRLFVREHFGRHYLGSRSKGVTQSAACEYVIKMLGTHVRNPGLKEASINEISAAARLRIAAGPDDAEQEAIVRREVTARFDQAPLMTLLVDELVVLEQGRGNGQKKTDAAPSRPQNDERPAVVVDAAPPAPVGEITIDDVRAIRDYWAHLAKTWWSDELRPSADCDLCGIALTRGRGYLSGASLLCTACMERELMDEGLTNLRQDPDYYGAGLLASARSALKDVASPEG